MVFQVGVEDGFRAQHGGKMVFTHDGSRSKLGATETMNLFRVPKSTTATVTEARKHSNAL